MDTRGKEFPPGIKAHWDALASKGIAPEALAAFEKYLFGNDAAKPGQVAAFSELMLSSGDPAFKPVAGQLFDELHEKYHRCEDGRESVRAITAALLAAHHGEEMRFVAENIIGSKGQQLITDTLNAATVNASKEVLAMPREQAKQPRQLMKSALRRHMLHALPKDHYPEGHYVAQHYEAPPKTLVNEPSAGLGRKPHPIEKKPVHHTLPPSQLLAGAKGARADISSTPAQQELFGEEPSSSIIRRVQRPRPLTPAEVKPKTPFVPAPDPAKGLVIRSDGASTWVTEQKPRPEPIPVTKAEIAEANRKQLAAKRRAAYEAGGGFMGAAGRAVSGLFTSRVEGEREPNPNPDNLVRGK